MGVAERMSAERRHANDYEQAQRLFDTEIAKVREMAEEKASREFLTLCKDMRSRDDGFTRGLADLEDSLKRHKGEAASLQTKLDQAKDNYEKEKARLQAELTGKTAVASRVVELEETTTTQEHLVTTLQAKLEESKAAASPVIELEAAAVKQ